MSKDFKAMTYVVDENVSDTIQWLLHHQDCYNSFDFDVIEQRLNVHHANGTDLIREGGYLNASYGILITSL